MKLGQEIVPFYARGLRLHVLQASQLLSSGHPCCEDYQYLHEDHDNHI